MTETFKTDSSPASLSKASMLKGAGPRVLIIRALEACNAGCFMCPFAFSSDEYRFTAQQANNLAEIIAGSTIRLVRLTGGEPLMLPDLVEIGRAFKSTRCLAFSIITNGYFVTERLDELRAGDVDQIIVSIDGIEESHDRFRQLPGLFRRAQEGIRSLRQGRPEVVLRVNTVVGRHNINELPRLYDTLCAWGVHQWSIIPLKRADGAWDDYDEKALRAAYDGFRSHVTARSASLRLLGHSLNWAGRDEDEFNRYWQGHQPMTPRGSCKLVDQVRYYTPKSGLVFPCNCVPHRAGSLQLSEQLSGASLTSEGLPLVRDWLRTNGPTACRGCEPANAALGEGAVDLDLDQFGF
jgi:cytosylglucuronate decarboxylase